MKEEKKEETPLIDLSEEVVNCAVHIPFEVLRRLERYSKKKNYK